MMAWFDNSVLAVAGGIGNTRAAAAARWAISERRPDVVISAGFSGGCITGLGLGDVVIASDVRPHQSLDLRGDVSDAARFECPPELIRTALAIGPPHALLCHVGTVVSTGAVLTSSEKRHLGETTGAIAVDMEAYAVAEVADSSAVPFIALKAVIDPVGEDLPDFVMRTGDGPDPRSGPALRYLLGRPWELGNVLHLARASSTASAALGTLVAAMADAPELSKLASPGPASP